jgi:hypothetical protein
MSAGFWFGGTADTVTVRMYGFASGAGREARIKEWRAEAAPRSEGMLVPCISDRAATITARRVLQGVAVRFG